MHNAIVTGGTRGIGYAIARDLARAGANVMITGRERVRLDAAVRRLSAEASGNADNVVGEVVDIRRRAEVDRLVTDTVARFGTIDVLVNNAGVGVFNDVSELSDDDWSAVIDTNLTGVFYATRAAIPPMRRGGGGWIINIASLAGRN